ncbi:MAG: site-specific DNA-methyltransferase [Chlorobi bacterium]|nr:site-specific DNA-methyltransferase [Chlorobiota bacterium]
MPYREYFDEFRVTFVNEQVDVFPLFEPEVSGKQHEQLKIYKDLERKFVLFNASSLRSQVHFQNAYSIPVQRWFPYREGYSLRLVNAFIKEFNVKGNIFDPFCGSGTTLLAARLSDLQGIGMDVNPISVLVARVENTHYTMDDIKKIKKAIQRLKLLKNKEVEININFELVAKVFNSDILNSLILFKNYILNINFEKARNFLFVAWLSIIESVSNIKKEGNGIKYKNRKRTRNGYINIKKDIWEKKVYPIDKFNFVKSTLLKQLELMLSDLQNNYGSSNYIPRIFEGNSLKFDDFFTDEINFTFFSPPYCNCFDYFEIHKIDLWLGGFVSNKEEFRILRNNGLRSNTNSLNHKTVLYKNKSLEKLIGMFDVAKLWSKKIPSVIRGYFDDMNILLSKTYIQTKKGGIVGIVVGNSAYSGVIVPSDLLISDIAREIGFKVKGIYITRHLTTSSQQKQNLEFLKRYLRESIILLEK